MSGVDIIYQLVQDDVKRPDKQAQIWRRIHRSILKMHRKDFWRRDLIEQIYQFDSANAAAASMPMAMGADSLFMNWFGGNNMDLNIQQIDTQNLVRYRKMDYIKKWVTVDAYGLAMYDPITGRQGTVQNGNLTECSPAFIGDAYGYDRQDIFYAAGPVITISSSTPLAQVFLGYFSDPKVNPGCTTLAQFEDYESWIADSNPALISTDVKKYIFADIGKNESELKGAQAEYAEELMAFMTSAINASTAKG